MSGECGWSVGGTGEGEQSCGREPGAVEVKEKSHKISKCGV